MYDIHAGIANVVSHNFAYSMTCVKTIGYTQVSHVTHCMCTHNTCCKVKIKNFRHDEQAQGKNNKVDCATPKKLPQCHCQVKNFCMWLIKITIWKFYNIISPTNKKHNRTSNFNSKNKIDAVRLCKYERLDKRMQTILDKQNKYHKFNHLYYS